MDDDPGTEIERKSRLGGAHAVVTGAASGIGRETVLGLAREGAASVVAVDTDAARLQELAQEASRLGGTVRTMTGDVSREKTWIEIERMVRPTGLNVLVNNAGVAYVKALEETSLSEWHHTLDVNLTSIFLSGKHLFPLMPPWSSVVNVASMAALIGQSITPAYIASKGGVVAITRSLAVDFAARRIRVNAVCPGYTDTPMIQRHFAKLGNGAEERAKLERRTPLGALVQPRDVASVILFLASHEARMMTGTAVVVDGGLSAVFDYEGEPATSELAASTP
jgi:NAD(P)-dependent dehydrogenase (short-subunit alcohol dehydrogenase family)